MSHVKNYIIYIVIKICRHNSITTTTNKQCVIRCIQSQKSFGLKPCHNLFFERLSNARSFTIYVAITTQTIYIYIYVAITDGCKQLL